MLYTWLLMTRMVFFFSLHGYHVAHEEKLPHPHIVSSQSTSTLGRHVNATCVAVSFYIIHTSEVSWFWFHRIPNIRYLNQN